MLYNCSAWRLGLENCRGYQNAFLIHQKEFNQSIATEGLVLIDDLLVFVIWKWRVLEVDEEDENEDEKMSELHELEADDEEEEDNEPNSTDVIHSITFKCILRHHQRR